MATSAEQKQSVMGLEIEEKAQRDRSRAQIRKWIGNILTWLMYVAIVVVFAGPLIWVIGNSFRSSQTIWENVFPVNYLTFLPFDEFFFDNYIEALGLTPEAQGLGFNLGRSLMISLGAAVSVVTLSLIFNTGAAYFFARLKVPRKNILLVYVIATMMIPQQVVIVPLFLVVNQLGLINTFWAMVVPWYASPFIVFALIGFFAELPYELDEAAILDGANLFQVLTRVIVPNAIPGLITVSILEFQFIWNEFFWPLVAVSNKSLQPVQVAIANQFTDRDPQWGRVFAAMVLASAPIVILFIFTQRYFYRSVALSGVKG
ncbi:MAG: carbohydrate ABC transporter permease [Chloroflexi bacterium]|nr:MAG: carbohydrate ABC transporter permease [Chloroflexota bacterium]MBL1192783.1 carbohydrate ABC transporter permease [Chloroflexota bacterium]NOH10077.1 carbohydrate ABC transporter permease [Chloroflexota bacterium]